MADLVPSPPSPGGANGGGGDDGSTSTAVISFLASLAIQTVVLVACLLTFEFLRRVYPAFYSARLMFGPSGPGSKKPRALRNGFLAWIPQVWTVPDSEIQQVAGMDAVAYLRTHKFGIELFVGIIVISLVTTLPINLSGSYVEQQIDDANSGDSIITPPPPAPCPAGLTCIPEIRSQQQGIVYSDLDRVTMSNIQPGSSVLWVHWLVTVLITIYALAVLRKYNLKSVASHLEFLRDTQPRRSPVAARTLLLTDVPGVPWNTLADTLVRAVQGPLNSITPKSVSTKLEKRLAEKYWVGSGITLFRSQSGREIIEKMQEENSPGSTAKAKAKRKMPSDEDDHSAVYDIEAIPELQEYISAWQRAKRELQRGLSVEEMIRNEMERVHGEGSVASVHVMASQDVLRNLFATYTKTKHKIVKLTEKYSAAICRREQRIELEKVLIIGPMYGAWGKELFGQRPRFVDSLKFNCLRLEYLAQRLEERRLDAEVLAEPSAFVTFTTLATTAAVGTALHHHDASSWQFEPAAEPKDVIWDNLGYRLWERRLRLFVVSILFAAACTFYVVPVALLQSVLTQDALLDNPFVEALTQEPTIRAILVLVLPSLGLTLLLLAMPPILGGLSRWRGTVSVSQVALDTVNQYFIFKVVVLFLGSLVSSAVIYYTLLNALLNQPSAIFEVLGATAPRQSFFFITYLLTQAFTIKGLLGLLGPWPLLVFTLKTQAVEIVEAKEQASKEIFPAYDWEVPTDTLTILLGVVFCVQNPLMPVVALLYFLVAGTVCRYNWLYVYCQQFQGGGLVWATISDHILAGLTIFLVFMIGYLQLLGAPTQSTLLLLPLAGVLLFWLNTKRQLGDPQRFLSMSESVTADEKFERLEKNDEVMNVYVPPFMKDDREELQKILENARVLRDALEGDMQATREIQRSFSKSRTSALAI